MSYRHTLEAALESLQDIEELIKGFPEDGNVPSIELDLSLQKLRNIYELLLVLKRPAEVFTEKQPAAASAQVSPPVPNPVHASEPVSEPLSAPPLTPISPTLPVQERETVAEVKFEHEIKETIRVPEPAAVSQEQSFISHKEPAEAQILSDRFIGRATLHESLHQSLGNEGQLHVQGKPVENLMSAIAINDRFTFIRELFNGDSPAFEYAIRTLNECANFNDAYNFMTRNYEWDMDSEAVQLLLDIIRRKYIISRHE